MVQYIADHAPQAIKRLIQQYQDRVKLIAIMNAVNKQIQDLEDSGQDMFTSLALDFAVGAQLDLFGRIVVQPREGFDDEFYRILLKVKIGINNSSGEPKAIINTIRLLTAATLVHYQNAGNGTILLGVNTEIDPVLIDFIYNNMEKVVMAGVKIDAIISFDPDDSFSFDGVGPVGLGFSSLADPSSGGKFAYINRPTFPKFAFSTITGAADPTGAGFGALADPSAGGMLVGL